MFWNSYGPGLVSISTSQDGTAETWGTTTHKNSGTLYKYMPLISSLETIQTYGSFKNISVQDDKNVWFTKTDNSLFHLKFIDGKVESITNVGQTDQTKNVHARADGRIFVINTSGKLYERTGNKFAHPGVYTAIAAPPNVLMIKTGKDGRVFLIDTDRNLFTKPTIDSTKKWA